MQRRSILRAIGASALVPAAAVIAAPALGAPGMRARIVVIGGGFGGATVAKYLRKWSQGMVGVTLIEPNAQFVSCPMSNLVIGGSLQMADITLPYASLKARHGVNVVQDRAVGIDPVRRTVQVAGGTRYPYDRLVVAPGVDFMWDQLAGMEQPGAQDTVLHAWKAGPQTLALRRQIEAMPDGGVFAISIPLAPYRCPPAPYERACQVARYLSLAKKKSKLLILDANEDVTSKPLLFREAWATRYAGLVDYQPKFQAVEVDAASRTLVSEFGDRVTADVLNVVPPQRAGAVAQQAGLANVNQRWCEVDFLSYESTQVKDIHVLGDAIQVAAQMPKSAHMANQQAKVCAAAILDLVNGRPPNAQPLVANACYSFLSESDAAHVSSVHAYDAERRTMLPVPGAGGLSPAATALEGRYARAWARNIWADSLG